MYLVVRVMPVCMFALALAVRTLTTKSHGPQGRVAAALSPNASFEGQTAATSAVYFPSTCRGQRVPYMIELRPPLTLSSKSEKEGIFGEWGSMRVG